MSENTSLLLVGKNTRTHTQGRQAMSHISIPDLSLRGPRLCKGSEDYVYMDFWSVDDLPAVVWPALLNRVAYIFGGLEDDINIAHIYHREGTQLQAAFLSHEVSVMCVCSSPIEVLNPASFLQRDFFSSRLYIYIHLPSLTHMHSFAHSCTPQCDSCTPLSLLWLFKEKPLGMKTHYSFLNSTRGLAPLWG